MKAVVSSDDLLILQKKFEIISQNYESKCRENEQLICQITSLEYEKLQIKKKIKISTSKIVNLEEEMTLVIKQTTKQSVNKDRQINLQREKIEKLEFEISELKSLAEKYKNKFMNIQENQFRLNLSIEEKLKIMQLLTDENLKSEKEKMKFKQILESKEQKIMKLEIHEKKFYKKFNKFPIAIKRN